MSMKTTNATMIAKTIAIPRSSRCMFVSRFLITGLLRRGLRAHGGRVAVRGVAPRVGGVDPHGVLREMAVVVVRLEGHVERPAALQRVTVERERMDAGRP